jgi:hypothetical protein
MNFTVEYFDNIDRENNFVNENQGFILGIDLNLSSK